ncbi:MAG TPA: MlaD family protein [Thermoanaerobaculia bacterium]|nr:MlaD family protein [Thermoanaerobaculia bacterium]
MSAAAKIGAFMIVILAILGYFIIRVEDIQLGAGETRMIEVVFDSVAGLDEKSAVRVAGVRVGKVDDISLLPDGRAKVMLEVDRTLQLRQGADARVASLGLLGEKYVELNPGPVGSAELPEGAPLRGSTTASIDELTGQVSEIATDVKAITGSLSAALGGPEGTRRMEEIVANVHEVTARLRGMLAANEANMNATAANFRQITDDLRVEIPRIAASIDRVANTIGGTVGDNREDIRVVVENLRGLSADLRTTADNLNAITGQVRSGEGSVGKLFFSDEAHEKLTGALAAVEGGVGELRDVVGRVNRIGLQLGIDGEYVSGFDEARFEGSSRVGIGALIIPNIDRNRFLNIRFTQDPRGDRSEKIIERTTVVDGVPTVVTETEVKFEKEFLISAQVGWVLDDYRVRLGLFDSYGGFGADWLASERVQVTGEMFDFGNSLGSSPQLRVFGRYLLRKEKDDTPAIFISSGVEDALNDPSFTFGGGIRWTDEDLKYLLGRIPMPN